MKISASIPNHSTQTILAKGAQAKYTLLTFMKILYAPSPKEVHYQGASDAHIRPLFKASMPGLRRWARILQSVLNNIR